MKKVFRITSFLTGNDFWDQLRKAASPYGGNKYPIQSTLEALRDPPLNCKTVVFERDYVDKGVDAATLVEEGDDDEPPTAYVSDSPRPDAQASSADTCQTLLKLLWEHPKVKASDELASYLLAVESGAATPAEIAEIGEMPVGRVYEARRLFNGIYPEIRKKLNKITEDSYER